MNLAVTATVFAIVLPAELPDKTALASLVLGTRYRACWVFAGVAAAFTLHVAVAVTAGRLLALLPHQVVQGLVTALFTLGAVLLLVGRHGKPDQALAAGRGQAGFLRVAGMAFRSPSR